MTRKTLSFFLTLCLAVSIVGVALADFDYSVFEDNEQFEFVVKFDAMDDTGSIDFPANLKPFVSATSDGDRIIVATDIKGIPDFAVILRVQMAVVSSWPDIKRIILLPDKTRYTITTSNNQESSEGTMYEAVTLVVTPDLIPMFEEIIDKQITSVQYRLDCDDADKNINGAISINVEHLKTLLDLYKAAGGMKQDFTSVDIAFPVTVK